MVHEEKKFLTISENYQYHERVDNLYPIHRNSLENINKIIRFITGKAFGVVLAGGGRKGWVHLGVIKALIQEKIPIDFIGGTSSGSIISSVYTLSEDFKNFEEQVSYLLGENEKVLSIRDFTFPAVAITNSERYTNKLINVFGDKKIEELTGNLFIVACNLTRKEQVVFRNGSIWEAIRASCAIPGIVPPMVIDEDLYVDGGVINNLPTDVMRQILGEQSKIIAVDLSFSTKSPPRFHFPPILGNFDLLKSKLLTKQYKLPSIKNIILRSLLVSSHQTEQQNLALADISIRPSLQGYDLFSSNTENLSELGYSETMRALENWQDAP